RPGAAEGVRRARLERGYGHRRRQARRRGWQGHRVRRACRDRRGEADAARDPGAQPRSLFLRATHERDFPVKRITWLFFLLVSTAKAQFPERPVHLVVPFAPGAATDTMSRAVALKL